MRLVVLPLCMLLALGAHAQQAPKKPRSALDFYNRGQERHAAGDLAAAHSDFGLAVAVNPAMAQAYANRGTVRVRQGKFEQAEQDISKAVALDPSLKPALEKYPTEMKRRRERQ